MVRGGLTGANSTAFSAYSMNEADVLASTGRRCIWTTHVPGSFYTNTLPVPDGSSGGRSLDQALEELPTTFSAAARARAHLHLALAARVLAPGRPARAPSGQRAGLPLPSRWSPDVPTSRAARTVVSGLTSRRRPRWLSSRRS